MGPDEEQALVERQQRRGLLQDLDVSPTVGGVEGTSTLGLSRTGDASCRAWSAAAAG